MNASAACDCSTGVSVCPAGSGGPSPPEWTSYTEDIMQDLTGRNVPNHLLKTYKKFIKKRWELKIPVPLIKFNFYRLVGSVYLG